LRSFVVLIDGLVAAHTRLISSYMRIGSSAVRRSRRTTATAPGLHTRDTDHRPAPAQAQARRDPAPALPTKLIEARAYEIFVRRGREPGNPVDDWRRAEAELRAEMTS
jgi:hypothetical protein